ncbi:MAG: hypothetical protein KGY76_04160, partial [Candidatus Thermoplasmatota archaeon]|nr:hypothetical protein [Candidatus Thermoplasmatota archaeon]
SIEQVSPPAGTFDTFELNRTISGDNEGYVQKNYAAAVKNTVKERADLNNTDWHRDLLTFNVTNRSSSMALSPSAGVPGNEVVVSGTFPDNASEDVRIWMPETGDEYLTSTDSEGKFNQSITVPDTSDRTPSPGENESIGVIAELKNNPTATYEVSTLEITEEPMAVSVNINDPAEGDVISKTNVTVKWSSQNAATHEVKIDEGTWDDVGTDTEHTFTGLSEGMHTVQVKAVGSGGDNATDSVSFEVNTTAPTVDITDPAEGEVFSTSEVTVSWTSDNTDYHEIRLDGGTWEDVSGNTSHTFDLEDGEHTVEVMATGGQGNNDTDNVSFLVDTTPPEINILQPAEGDTFNVTEVLVEWEGTPEGTAIEYYETSIDEGAWEDVGTDTERTFTGLSDGDHMVEVKGTDEAGNSGYEAVNFTIETEEKKANITVSDFSVSPLEGYAPLDVNITGEIENTGSAEGTVNLTIDGQNIDSWTVGAGGTETVDKTHEFQEIGNHTISIGDQSETVTVNEEEPGEADIQVNSFDVNRTEGEVPFEVEITGEIENVGDAEGSINLTIEGDIIDSWTLSAGENRSIEIIHNFEQTGNYTVELGDRSETITASQTDDDGTDDGSDDGTDNGTDDTSDNESDGGDDSPGFTLPVLAMAMTLVLLVYRIKKDKR